MRVLRSAFLLGLLWLVPGAAQAQAPAPATFGTDDIHRLMSGTTIRAIGVLSRRPVLLTFESNQSLSGRFEPPHEHETDTGKWWARDGRLCWQWTKWEDQKVNCIRLAYENGAIARWHPSNGTRLADWAIRTAGPRVAEIGAPAAPPVAAAPASRARPAAPPPERFDDIHFGNHHALVIGNNAYRKLNKLKSAENDARAVAAVLESAYGHKVELILNATRAQVIAALTRLRGTLTPDDNLLIYYAGHGTLDSVAEQGYWLPVDAEPDVPTNWISTADLTTLLRAIRANHVMIVADSCYSGTLVRAADAQIKTATPRRAWLERMASKRARTALVSGGLEPVVDGGGGGKHSVFAREFLAALNENLGVMDGQAVFERIKRPLALNADQTPQYSDIRHAGHDGGDYLFVRR